MSIEQRLQELGIELPPPPAPAANYLPWVEHGGLVYVSGQLPMAGGKLTHVGHVGADLTEEEGYEAARLCTLNGLSILREALGGLDHLGRVVRVEGFVRSAPGFTGQPRVINGCSDLLKELLGERGAHARMALGCNELPLGAAVEIAFIAARSPAAS